MSLRAAIVGLGRIGSRFDEEPGRKAVWSHAGAYLACADRFLLAGAAEPDAGNAAAFRRRCPDVPVFASAERLFAEIAPEVVSICTPVEQHAAALHAALGLPGLKAIWCEKPLAGTLGDAEVMVAACAARGVPLIVSHVRRWLPLWRRVAERIEAGDVGTPVTIRIAMPNRLFSIGSHAVDLALMLGGEAVAVSALPLPALEEEGEPAVAALLGLASGAYAVIQVTGRKHALIIEAEVIGTEGRLFAREDEGRILLDRFADSPRYAGYRELRPEARERMPSFDDASPFVEIAREIARLAADPSLRPSCDGAAALAVQRVLARLADAASDAVPAKLI
ncbi:MAG: Gfo/Idh/MocA family protein [Alphaproteobacteria bacterium]